MTSLRRVRPTMRLSQRMLMRLTISLSLMMMFYQSSRSRWMMDRVTVRAWMISNTATTNVGVPVVIYPPTVRRPIRATSFVRMAANTDDGIPIYPVPRKIDEALLGDLTGGRPGAIIETEEQLMEKEDIISDIERGIIHQDELDILKEYYGKDVIDDEEEGDVDSDDSEAIDASTWGTWTIQDLRSKFPYEYDPLDPNDVDPNIAQLHQPNTRYLAETPKDDDNVEIGYDPIFGPSNPLDTRTILGAIDSYMIDSATKNDTMLEPQFPIPNDPEIMYNEEIVQFRKSLDILETYTDTFLPSDMIIPRRVATWYGYPEPMYLTPQNFSNNRFTDLDRMTNFDTMSPYDARKKAVELARSKNAEWLPNGVSQQWHQSQRAPYEKYATKIGTLQPGDCDPELVSMIQPALSVLGSCCQLLSIEGYDPTDGNDEDRDDRRMSHPNNDNDENYDDIFSDGGRSMTYDSTDDDEDDDDSDSRIEQQQQRQQPLVMISTHKTIYRFAYHGLMKNKYGMACWTTTLLQDCGVPVTNVIFETGFRKRDPIYDGGDPWYAPIFSTGSKQ